MNDHMSIKRKALGRISYLGYMYDARREKIISISILNGVLNNAIAAGITGTATLIFNTHVDYHVAEFTLSQAYINFKFLFFFILAPFSERVRQLTFFERASKERSDYQKDSFYNQNNDVKTGNALTKLPEYHIF